MIMILRTAFGLLYMIKNDLQFQMKRNAQNITVVPNNIKIFCNDPIFDIIIKSIQKFLYKFLGLVINTFSFSFYMC